MDSLRADTIDIHQLLLNYNGDRTTDSLIDYLKVTQSDDNTLLSIDQDGAGTAYSSTPLLTLTNTSVDVATLLQNQQLIF